MFSGFYFSKMQNLNVFFILELEVLSF